MVNRVLVALAEPLIAEAIAGVLGYNNLFEVISVNNAESFILHLEFANPDVIICSTRLPGATGYQLLAYVREKPEYRSILFIFITAMDKYTDIREGMDAGADDYLTLPFLPDQLLNCMHARLLRRSQLQNTLLKDITPPSQPITHHIFMSYSHKDPEFMSRVKATIDKQKLSLWTDEDLASGTPVWSAAIEKAIENTGCLIILMTPDAKTSEWIRNEINYAKELGKPIYPILAAGDKRSSVPIEIITAQFSDVRNDFQGQMEKLLKTIRKDLKIIG